jgi:4-methylaminobutanoate oxidase (formaldehyde-forming)
LFSVEEPHAMPTNLPSRAQVVIIGGGVVGCSVAYHLTKLGWRDVVLLERRQLTSGTTWHAAGLVGQLRATHNMTRLAKYSADLYRSLEEETGQATGFRQRGSIMLATDDERMEELRRGASMARCFGLETRIITPDEVAERWPLARVDDLVGAVHIPSDGQTNPVDTTQALARGARNGGARILENIKVTDIRKAQGRVTGVVTEDGEIEAEYVVNCAGMWSHEIGRLCGVNLPLHAAEHFYVVTEGFDGLAPDLPVLRDPNNCLYFKEDAGKLLIGMFEPVAKPWGMDGIPEDFCFDELPEDWEHLEPQLDAAMERVPALQDTGIQVFFNGPESFTPDDRYLLGEAPELRNFFVACGFNSVGIQSAGGAGKVLSEWIVNGHPPMDVADVDVRRMQPFQGNRRYLHDRTVEGLGLLYAMHWPFRQFETARPARTSPVHDRLASRGACFGETAGWERPNWFAPAGEEPAYRYSWWRQNWFQHSAREHRAVRENVGLFDQSSFAKYLVQGRDAEAVLNRIAANNVAVAPGRVVYTPLLNERGGIEADVTITRLSETEFLVVSPAASQVRDLAWLRRNTPEDAHAFVTDVTSGYAVLGIMGPNARALLQPLTDARLSNEAFPFGTSREIDLGYARVRASRLSYVGELGWELYMPTEFAQPVFDVLTAAGENHDLAMAGFHAMNSLRVESAMRHWGDDITEEDTPIQAGLKFAVDLEKSDFIGRDALLRQLDGPLSRRLVCVALKDPEPLLYHDEPIWLGEELVGRTTSAMYGHTVGAAVGLGYITHPDGVDGALLRENDFQVEVAGERVPATLSLRPFHDPGRLRMRR